jgi:hypothetical protein
MPDDWVFSFSSFDDLEEDEFKDEPVSYAKRPNVPLGTAVPPKSGLTQGPVSKLQMTKEEELKQDLDISTRADPAIFQKTPWTVAKLNALSRAKTSARTHDNNIEQKAINSTYQVDSYLQTTHSSLPNPNRSPQCLPPAHEGVISSKAGETRQEPIRAHKEVFNKSHIPRKTHKPPGRANLATSRSDLDLLPLPIQNSDPIYDSIVGEVTMKHSEKDFKGKPRQANTSSIGLLSYPR